MVILLIGSVKNYLTTTTESLLSVEESSGLSLIDISMNIVFPKMPCELVSIDVIDVMGNHEGHIGRGLKKRRLSNTSQPIGNFFDASEGSSFDTLKVSRANREGCELEGVLSVNRVPGSFHISCHDHSEYITRLLQSGLDSTFDYGHKISYLYIGGSGIEESLKRYEAKDERPNPTFVYYLNVVPSKNTDGTISYPYTMNYHSFQSNNIPSVVIR